MPMGSTNLMGFGVTQAPDAHAVMASPVEASESQSARTPETH